MGSYLHHNSRWIGSVDTAIEYPASAAYKFVNWWPLVLSSLTTHPPGQTEPAQVVFHEYRRLVVEEFAGQRWNSRRRVKGLPRSFKRWVQAEAKILNALLDLLQEVKELSPATLGARPNPLWFMALVAEYEAWSQSCFEDDEPTKTQFLKRYRGITKQLQAGENPFQEPSTAHLFNAATRLAGRNDNFRRDRFTPFIKARQGMATVIQSQGFVFQNKGGEFKLERQGRKKVFSGTRSQQGIQRKRSS